MRPLSVPFAVLVAVLVCAPPAFGHAAFVGSDPAPGQRLEASPARITLVFTEPVNSRLARVTVRPAAGGPEVPMRVRVDDRRRLVATPARRLARGAYTVRWHTVSTEDGHALEGAFAFGVQAAAGAAPALETGPLARAGWVRILTRVALYTTLLTLVAALLLPLLIRRPRGWPVPDALTEPDATEPAPQGGAPPQGGGVAVAAARSAAEQEGGPVAIATEAPRAAPPEGGRVDLAAVRERARELRGDLAWAAVVAAVAATLADAADAARGVDPARLADYLVASVAGFGRVLAVVALVACALLRDRRPRVAAGAAVLALGGIAASGHAGSADPRVPSILNDWLHLVSGAVWLGGIALLVLVWWPEVRFSRRSTRLGVARHVLAPFGPVAAAGFALAVSTGLVSLVTQLGRVAALWDTGYGRLLAFKIAFVGLIAAASAAHALRLRPRLLAANPHPPERLERRHWRLWRSEPVLGLAVVAAVAGLVAFPLPPRQLAQAGDARAAVCDPCPLPRPAADELAVADAAGSHIVAAWIRRTPAAVTGTVRLLDFRGRPSGVPVELPGATGASCGEGCRRFRLPASASTVEVAVSEDGRRHTAALPARWDAGGSRRARDLLARAEAAMRGLRGVRELERISSGPGTGARTEYRLRAPDRLAWRTGRGVQSVVVGDRQWLRTPASTWRSGPYGSGLEFNTRSWFAWQRYARTVRLLGERTERGRRLLELALMDEGTPVWFRLTIDADRRRVLSERMIARARFVDTMFTDFGRQFAIEPPEAAR